MKEKEIKEIQLGGNCLCKDCKTLFASKENDLTKAYCPLCKGDLYWVMDGTIHLLSKSKCN